MTKAAPDFEVNVKNNYVDCVDLSNGRTRQRLPLPDGAASADPAGAHRDRSPSRLPESR
jgi:hypothetical protein